MKMKGAVEGATGMVAAGETTEPGAVGRKGAGRMPAPSVFPAVEYRDDIQCQVRYDEIRLL